MRIAAIIIGIDGWEQYTLPLIESLQKHEPKCLVTVIDNLSEEPYPTGHGVKLGHHYYAPRLCYSAAINFGKRLSQVGEWDAPDWYIVLSNDVLCTGPFAHLLEQVTNGDLVGPCMKQVHGFDYLEGWCVCVPRGTWDAVGGWDEAFLGSDYEDVDFSTSARERGYGLVHDTRLPFTHLDQRQRFHVVEDFAGKNAHNRDLFLRKHARVTA